MGKAWNNVRLAGHSTRSRSDGARRKAYAVRSANGWAGIRGGIKAGIRGAHFFNMLHGFVRKSCNIWQHPGLFRCWYQGLYFNMLNEFVRESFNIFKIRAFVPP